jgi:uncharacterized LabA/DUF88 family protein
VSTAILVDGGFFVKRYRHIYKNPADISPQKVARNLHESCIRHLFKQKEQQSLYRIFFYDCPPIAKRVHHPITKKSIVFANTLEAIFRNELHIELRKLRKVALRLGRLSESSHWQIKPEALKKLLNKTILFDDIKESDLFYDVKQKGVDMKIGLDIASLAYKKLVSQIILIAGDSDFVPAAKLARREGIDFILDPMWNPVNQDLHEHVDGISSTFLKPGKIDHELEIEKVNA